MQGHAGRNASATYGKKSPPGARNILVSVTLLLCAVACGSNGTPASPVSAKSWEPAQILATDNEIHNPVVAADPAGNLVAVWEQKGALDNISIFAKRYVPGSGWDRLPTKLSAMDDADAQIPRVAVDDAGNAIVVWYQGNAGVWSRRYTVGTGWQTAPEAIDNSLGNTSGRKVSLAMNAAGTAFAAWEQPDPGSGFSFIWANRYVPGTGWEGARQIESGNAGSANESDVAVDASGNAIAVWYQDDGTGLRNIWANRYAPGAGWGTPEVIQNNAAIYAMTPKVAMDRNGNGVAAWRQDDGTRRYPVWAARYVSGSGWQPAQQIGAGDTTNLEPKNAPHVAMDASGNAIAVWAETDGAFFHVFANRYATGAGWSPPDAATRLESDNTVSVLPPYISPWVAMDPSGNAMAVWTKPGPGGRVGAHAARYAVGSGWGPATLIGEDSTGDADKPVVMMDPQGNAFATWEVNDPTAVSRGRGYLRIYR